MLKLSRENKSAPAPIHARSNDSPCTRADFPAKKRSRFDDQKVHVIAALFINYCLQLAFIYFFEDQITITLVKQNCVVDKIWSTKNDQK